MKFYVRTYGCQMNVADSNEMARHLQARGFRPTDDPEEASVLLVNTCTVRQHAEDRAMSEVGRLKKWKARRPGRKIVVTGCAAERTKEYIEDRFPHVDLVVGAKSIESFGPIVEQLLDRRPTDDDLDYATQASHENVSAYVTIMRGCNYSCSYCIVPYVRGRESYHATEQILNDVRDRVREGAREIILLGQTVNSYHSGQHSGNQGDGNRSRGTEFAGLLEAVSAVDGVERIRFMSPHPYYMTDRVIEAMAELPPVCEALHLPMQSGSDVMLKKMQRNYTRAQYLCLMEKLRKAMPGMTISTDIIVGFPGETDQDFRETLSLIQEAKFNWGFIFKYSARMGTPAAQWESFPEELIERRHQECLEVLERSSLESRAGLAGSEHDVLIESENAGRTRTNYKVRVEEKVVPGETVKVRITNSERGTLDGVVLGRNNSAAACTDYADSIC